jgi:hypothetical protein
MSASRRKTLPLPPFNIVSKNLILTAYIELKCTDPQFTENQKSSECCAACHHIKMFQVKTNASCHLKYCPCPIKPLYYKIHGIQYLNFTIMGVFLMFLHSFHWHLQNVTIPCHLQELLPFLSVIYLFLPLFSTH